MILIISAVFPPEPVVSATLSKDIADELSTTHNVAVLHPKPTRPDGYLFEAEKLVLNYGSMKERLKNQYRNQKDIEFLNVPDGKVPETQAKVDVMLLLIKKGAASSSIPSKLPAYMFSCKPIIASIDSDSDTAEAIMNSGCGWVVEPENTDALADKMEKMATKIGNSGCEYAIEHFSRKNISKITQIILCTKK